jgi:hypothetical protein
MRGHDDRHRVTRWILESATPRSISSKAGHASEMQIVKNPSVRHAGFAGGVRSHVPSHWPHYTFLICLEERFSILVYLNIYPLFGNGRML